MDEDIELLHCDEDLLVWIPSHSGPFSADGHFPILAGHNSHGQNAYIACIVHNPDARPNKAHFQSYFYTATVTEGDAFARFWHEGSPWSHDTYYVLALRHDPLDILPGSFVTSQCDVHDQTGPFYWTKSNINHTV